MTYKQFKKDFPQGCSVTCEIKDRKINDAMISYNEDGSAYICQNLECGIAPQNIKTLNLLGYKQAWLVFCPENGFDNYMLKDLKRVGNKSNKLELEKALINDRIIIKKDEITIDGKDYTIEEIKAQYSELASIIKHYNNNFK